MLIFCPWVLGCLLMKFHPNFAHRRRITGVFQIAVMDLEARTSETCCYSASSSFTLPLALAHMLAPNHSYLRYEWGPYQSDRVQ
jgi:hypothetical protein